MRSSFSPPVQCSVEEARLAVGEVVGCDSVRSASRMNGAIVLFLDSTAKVCEVVVKGVVIHNTFTPVSSLLNPATKITILNAPPFIKNELLGKELSRYGQLVSPIRMVSLGCKSPKLKHVVCHRRQVFMILKERNTDLSLSFSFKVDGFNYVVFVSSETMKCFGCGGEGHLVRTCPRDCGARRAAAGGDPPADVTPAPVTVWGTHCYREAVFFCCGGAVRRGDPPAAPVPVVAGALVPEVSSEADIERGNIESEKVNNKVKKTSSQMSTESESDFLLTQLDSQCNYSPEKIKAFLEQTERARLPNVGEVFSRPTIIY